MKTLRRNLLTAYVLLLSTSVFGQGLTIESVVDTRLEGALGSMVGLAARVTGNSLHDVATTTYLQGHQLRTDSARAGTIYDLDAERVINIDHKPKTYSSMTFAEMKAAMEKARASAEQSRAKEEAKAAKADPKSAGKKDDVKMKYQVAVDRTGQHEKICGYDAERVFITITLEAEATPEGEKTEQIGSMVLLLDQWIAKDAPQVPAYAAFYRLFSQKLGREFHSQAQGLQAAFASDPRLKEGFEAAGKEMQKVPGIALRSATHAILVPANMTLDRKLALDGAVASAAASAKSAEAAPAEKPKSGFGGFMRALKTVAEDATKQMDNGNQKKNSPPKQSTLLVMTDEVKSIKSGAVPSAVFAPPADYREVKQKTP
ncbi:MAG: hypothetical protein ABIZ81_02145 [Opitutaceae bacterium]